MIANEYLRLFISLICLMASLIKTYTLCRDYFLEESWLFRIILAVFILITSCLAAIASIPLINFIFGGGSVSFLGFR